MKRLIAALGFMLLVSPVLARTAFATDADTIDKNIAKEAPAESSLVTTFKPRLLCTCVSGPDAGVIHKPGVVVLAGLSDLDCVVPGFDATGKVFSLVNCNGDFVILH